MESGLIGMCIEAATQSGDAIERWRRQRRTLESMSSQLAEALLHSLLRRRLLFPSLLEVFKQSVEDINLRGERSVFEEWMAYLGAFRYLHSLNIADCCRINSSALWAITGLPYLKVLDVSRCSKVTDAGLRHLLSIQTLESLCISETGVTAKGAILLSSLINISTLDLGALPVTDVALGSLQALTKIHHLDLWGSEISNEGSSLLKRFPKLSFLNLAWTKVTDLQNISSLACLNMSNCKIHSLLEGEDDKAPLEKLILSETTFLDASGAIFYVETSFMSYLDLSYSLVHGFGFLTHMVALEYLNLSGCSIADDAVELIACIGANLRCLNLSNTKVSSAGVGTLAGHVPCLETISLSYTAINDLVMLYLSMMPSLKVVDLNGTTIKGMIHQTGTKPEWVLSLASLQNLSSLERLNLEKTQIVDAALCPLSTFSRLSYISLRSGSLTDMSLYHLSSIRNLIELSMCDAVLTNNCLDSFNLQPTLKVMDIKGCWLLTEDAISAFCLKHPQIEVRHKLAPEPPSYKHGPSNSFPMQVPRRTSQSGAKPGKFSTTAFKSDSTFIDQRMKYSREELLALKLSSASLRLLHDKGS